MNDGIHCCESMALISVLCRTFQNHETAMTWNSNMKVRTILYEFVIVLVEQRSQEPPRSSSCASTLFPLLKASRTRAWQTQNCHPRHLTTDHAANHANPDHISVADDATVEII